MPIRFHIPLGHDVAHLATSRVELGIHRVRPHASAKHLLGTHYKNPFLFPDLLFFILTLTRLGQLKDCQGPEAKILPLH